MTGRRDGLAGLRHEDLVSYLRTTFAVTDHATASDSLASASPSDRVLA